MIILQELSQKLPNSAPESTFSFWFISQVVVTLIIFVGVYIILKPVFSKEKEKQEKSKNKE
ncbi:MAG: flagellar biosynthesis/type III secretory pathway M-ring protein FliF/YscJ [Bacteroidia bacterium]|jgi:flagellar biosynthesis/type III secretory pathway M-ring protein FliF/YscJ